MNSLLRFEMSLLDLAIVLWIRGMHKTSANSMFIAPFFPLFLELAAMIGKKSL
jgi:hypothetical protein